MNKQTQSNSDMLIALYYNIKTAMQNITNVLEKVEDTKLKQLLRKQLQDYTRYQDTCEDLAQVYGIDIMDNNMFKKMQMWMSVNMAIIFDRSNRKIASINIFGTTMGIIDLIGLISDNKKARPEFLALANQILELEKSNIEKLKPYLLKENQKKLTQKNQSAQQDTSSKPKKSTSKTKEQPTNKNDKTKTNNTNKSNKNLDNNNINKTTTSDDSKYTSTKTPSVEQSKQSSPALQDDLYTLDNKDIDA